MMLPTLRRAALLIILLLLPASASAVDLASAVLSSDVSEGMMPLGVSDRFSAAQTVVHAVVLLTEVPSGARIGGAWVAVDAVAEPDYPIGSEVVVVERAGFSRIHFALSRDEGTWPPGRYRLDLSADGKPLGSVPFSFIDDVEELRRIPLVSAALFEKVDPDSGRMRGVSDIFTADTPEIHSLVLVQGLEAGQALRGTWIAENAFQDPDRVIHTGEEATEKDGTDTVHFGIAWTEPLWPTGRYRFEVALGERILLSVPYFVVPAAEASSAQGFDLGSPVQDESREWTVAVYLDGDNNLESFALKDLDEMERAHPGSGLEVIVLMDRSEGFASGDGDWKGARVYRVRQDKSDGIRSPVLADLGEVNMGDPKLLESFLSAAMTSFPARRYALILWDHGGGWAAHVTDDNAPGAPGDFDRLTLPELREAVAGALSSTGRERLDLAGFDMCLMAQVETALELEGLADFMVASEATEPGDGWPYEAVVPLFADPRLETAEVASRTVAAYDDYYRAGKESTATLSALDLRVAGALSKAFDAFLSKAEKDMGKNWQAFTRALALSEGYGTLADTRRGPGALASVDLGDTVDNLARAVPELGKTDEYRTLKTALKRFVVASRTSDRHRRSQGAAIYAPFRSDLLAEGYASTRFARQSSWPATLKRLYQAQEKNPSEPKITGVQTVTLRETEGLSGTPAEAIVPLTQGGFQMTYEGRNILWTHFMAGKSDPRSGNVIIFEKHLQSYVGWDFDAAVERAKVSLRDALVSTPFPDGRIRLESPFQGMRYLACNGEGTAAVTLDASDVDDLEARMVSVPALFEHPDVGRLFATISFDWLWQAAQVTLAVPQKDGSTTYMSVNPPPEAKVTFLMETISPKGERSYAPGDSLKWSEGLFLVLDPYPAGEYQAVVALESLTGFSATRRHGFAVAPREDNLFGMMDPGDYRPENFLGLWAAIDTDILAQTGQVIPLAGRMMFEPHGTYQGALKVTFLDEKGRPAFPDQERIALLHRGPGLPHSREITLDTSGSPIQGIEPVYYIFSRDPNDGELLLYALNVRRNRLWAFVRQSGPSAAPGSPTQQPAGLSAPPPPAAPSSPAPGAFGSGFSPLEGTWQAQDGTAVVFQGRSWAFYSFGQQINGGDFQVQGNQVTTQSQSTGEVVRYSFQVMDNRLLLADSFGQTYQFYRVR